jgi:uncharacterized protein
LELTSPFTLDYAYKRSLGPVLSRFFTALRDGRLEGVRTATGRVLFPPLEYDPETGHDVGDPVEVGPGGAVVTHTWVPEGGFGWVLVTLDGADTGFLHRFEGDPAVLAPGLRVTARLKEDRVGHITDIACFEVEA